MPNRIAIALTLTNLALLVALAVQRDIATAAASAQPVLRAQLIELVDARGVVRGQLRTEDDGDVVLRLRDQRGNIRVKLGANEMGSGLLLADDKGDVGVHILSGMSKLTTQRDTMVTLADPAVADA
jgi:hypothetical protein